MDCVDDKLRIEEFLKKHPEIEVSYGGDGAILGAWRAAVQKGKTICPVRNYGRCEKHADPFASVNLDAVCRNRIVVCEHVARGSGLSYKYDALSEIQVKGSDVTSALRMDVYVDGTKFCENVIADGVLCSTPFGATGYFSSVARTLFTSGLGFAFIAPTIGVNNLVLPFGHKIEISPCRSAEVVIAADKATHCASLNVGDRLFFYADPDKTVEFAGLDVFHCPVCRACRHGTTVVNQYFK